MTNDDLRNTFFLDFHWFKGSGVQDCDLFPRTAFGMRIYKKNVSFVRPISKFGAKLAIIWENEHFQRGLRVFDAFFVLNPEL
jgi:hypothetical protein